MTTPREEDLIYDWNTHVGVIADRTGTIELDDETLRDGLQNPSVTDPPVEKKFELLRLMSKLKIDAVNLGLPGAGPRARADITRMAEVFRMAAPLGAEAVLSRMQEELRQFTGEGPQMDDITLVAIERRK